MSGDADAGGPIRGWPGVRAPVGEQAWTRWPGGLPWEHGPGTRLAPGEEASVSSVPLPLGGSSRPAPAGRRTASSGTTRFARPDPSGPGAAKLLDNLRRLGAPADGTAPRDRLRRRAR